MSEIHVTLILLITEPFSTASSEKKNNFIFIGQTLQIQWGRQDLIHCMSFNNAINLIMGLLKTEKLQQEVNSVLLSIHK